MTILSQKNDLRNNCVYPKVFVVGMSRTGTFSIKRALETLYRGKAYHMSEVINKPQHLQFWSELISGTVKPEEVDWRQFFEGYIAITDMPSAHFFEPIAKAFPKMKVVLTYRNEQDWLNSYTRLMSSAMSFRFIRFLPPLNRLWPFSEKLHELLFGETAIDKGKVQPDRILAGYRKHNRQVRLSFHNKNLLEFRVKDGWPPLCDFLEVDIPSTPFPHRNVGGKGPAKILANAVGRLSLLPILSLLLLIVLSIGFVFLISQK